MCFRNICTILTSTESSHLHSPKNGADCELAMRGTSVELDLEWTR